MTITRGMEALIKSRNFFWLFVLLGFALQLQAAPLHKPRAPLSLTLSATAGEGFELGLRSLLIPAKVGVEVVRQGGGAPEEVFRWQGDMLEDGMLTLPFNASLGAGQILRARAWLLSVDGKRFTVTRVYQPRAAARAKSAERSWRLQQRRGQQLREYSLP